MNSKVEDFLNRHNLNVDNIDIQQVCDYLMTQMKQGLEGKEGSLPMIPSFCSPDVKPKKGESAIVIDAGGTNFRTCLVSFDENLMPVISDYKKSKMPGSTREVPASEFFAIIADETERLLDKSDRIGFCFSYAAEILPNHDGVPKFFSKEIRAPEVVGMQLGKELLAELARRGHDVSKKKIIILNDTVTTLLAAQSRNAEGKFDGCIGFILGTGTNTAYIEKNQNITKLDPSLKTDGYQIINVESGSLSITLGDIDKAFLDKTDKPELYNFEKMISGAYLGPLAQFIINHAIEEGLFSQYFAFAFAGIDSLSTIELNRFLNEEDCKLSHCISTDEDFETLLDILGNFIARTAKLTAANIASAVLITEFGKDEDHPVLVNADGTTFHKTAFLKSYTTEYLDAFLAEKGRRAVITNIEDSPIIGSAIGALSL